MKTHTTKPQQSTKASQISLTKGVSGGEEKREGEISKGTGEHITGVSGKSKWEGEAAEVQVHPC